MDFQVLYQAPTTSSSPAPQPSAATEELPVIWLAAPASLLPSDHDNKIHPVPLAVSATLTCLIVLVLVILYNRKPEVTKADDSATKTETATDTGLETMQMPHATPRSHYSIAFSHSTAHESSFDSLRSILFDELPPPRTPTPPHMMYHDYLHNGRHESYQLSHESPQSVSVDSYYRSPEGLGADNTVGNHVRRKPITAASSNYSVSIDETAFGSRQNSTYRRESEALWTRLRLGSEYDGDRTFVPSEVNLQLGKGSERWG